MYQCGGPRADAAGCRGGRDKDVFHFVLHDLNHRIDFGETRFDALPDRSDPGVDLDHRVMNGRGVGARRGRDGAQVHQERARLLQYRFGAHLSLGE